MKLKHSCPFPKNKFALCLTATLAYFSVVPAGWAADAVDLGSVGGAAGANSTGAKTKKDAVLSVAPTQVSLEAVQPQSVISGTYIQEHAMAGSNYADIINFAPGVFSVDPNGSGLMESQALTIRGFQDGQYNVTFDGIPWGDSNDFTHHSTVYFMPQDISKIAIDRGPGDASTFGDATFGGTIAMSSKILTQEAGSSVFGSFGTWNTRLFGADHQTGNLESMGDARFYVSYKNLNSDGFLTNSGQKRDNVFAKFEKPISGDTVLTVASMYNQTTQHVPNGSTLSQQQMYGYNFGLNNNANSEANSSINYDQLKSDFEYIGIKSRFSDWTIDNKVYTYGYYHHGYYGLNPGSVTAADTVADGGTSNGPNNVPGLHMFNNYRSVGDMFNASKQLGPGTLSLGFWMDQQSNQRFEQGIDWSANGAPNTNFAANNGIDRLMNDTLTTQQLYAKYDLKLSPDWTLDIGGKYASFTRNLDAPINQKTQTPFTGAATWGKFLPSAISRYNLSANASVYAQYAEGFLAPNLNVFYKTTPNLSQVQPTDTKNYQLGTNWASNTLNAGVDVYHITSTNLATGVACPVGITGTCYNAVGGVTYNGIEFEATQVLGGGFSLYGNFAHNGWTTSDGSVLQNAPVNNAAIGLIYSEGNLYASLMDKLVSTRYSNVDAMGNNIQLPGYGITNFNLTYTLDALAPSMPKGTKVGMGITNLFNQQGNLASLNSAVSGDPLYFVLPTRSVQVNMSLPF